MDHGEAGCVGIDFLGEYIEDKWNTPVLLKVNTVNYFCYKFSHF